MSFQKFKDGVRDLLARHYETPELSDETAMSVMDSLGITEICQLGDDWLEIELGYKDVRSCEKFGDIKKLVASRGVQVD